MKNNLVSVEWLKNNFDKDNLVILDSSPENTVTGKISPAGNLSIPKSRIFNIKEHFTDKENKFPNPVPSATQFEKGCRDLGINRDSEIVVYDNLGVYTSPRVWWLFKVMGHDNISVLNGGLLEWINEGCETVKKSNLNQGYKIGNFKSKLQSAFILKYEDIIDNIKTKKFLLIDARSKGRFNGTAQEPRKHLKSGHIPSSINIPYKSLLENGKFKSKETLKAIFEEQTSGKTELVFSCGSGMTACIVMLASEIAYTKSTYLYDGSWTEYAELQNLRMEF